MSHCIATKFIRPVSSQTLCHVLAGAAATWPSAQHNRTQTAEVMISHSETRQTPEFIPVFVALGKPEARQHVSNHGQKPVKPGYLYVDAYNVYYVKLH